MTLDEGHACPEPRGARGRDEARRPAADDHEVVARGRGRVGPAGRVHVRDEHAVVLVVGLDQRRRYRRRRFRVRFIPRRVRERAAGDARDVQRDGHGRDETPEVERLLQGSARRSPRRQLGEAGDQGPQVDVHDCPRQHADQRADEVVAQRDPREAEGVVEEVEGEDGREPDEEHDPESLPADRAVDRREARARTDAGGDRVARERAPEEERGRGADVRRDPHDPSPHHHPVREAGSERQNDARQEEHRREHVDDREDDDPLRARASHPRDEVEEPALDRQEPHRRQQRDHQHEGGETLHPRAGRGRGANRGRRTHCSAPPQLDPAPAVQPKQWLPVAIGRVARASIESSSQMVRTPAPSGSSSIWLKSQS